jgi:hypothetical protein
MLEVAYYDYDFSDLATGSRLDMFLLFSGDAYVEAWYCIRSQRFPNGS